MKKHIFKRHTIVSLMIVVTLLLTSVVSAENANTAIVGEMSKISSELQAAMLSENGKIPVMAWLEDIGTETVSEIQTKAGEYITYANDGRLSFEGATLEEVQSFIMKERNLASKAYIRQNSATAKKLFDTEDIIYISKFSPVVLVELTPNEIMTLSAYSDVVSLGYHKENKSEDLSIALQTIRANDIASSSYYGETGEGINIGVFEVNIVENIETKFPDITVLQSPYGNSDIHNTHPDMVLRVLSEIAPDANYFVADDTEQTYMEAIEWLLEQGVNVINASRVIGGDPFNTYGGPAKWLDHVCSQHYVHFVKTAGNYREHGVNSGGMAYNVITVGGIDNYDTAVIDDDTMYFYSAYYSNRPIGGKLAQKPDICAPAVNVMVNGEPATGTSVAAPQVTGAVALICDAKPELLTEPEAVKAILQSSVRLGHTLNSVTADDSYITNGAGVLDVKGALWVTQNGRYELGAFPATATNTTSTHTMTVESSDTVMRIAVAYILKTVVTQGHTTDSAPFLQLRTIPDLNIEVYAPGNSETPIVSSYVPYGNVEIVSFNVDGVYGDYTIKINMLAETAPLLPTWYAVAWR